MIRPLSHLYAEIRTDLAVIARAIIRLEDEHCDSRWREIKQQLADLAKYAVEAEGERKSRDREEREQMKQWAKEQQ